MIERDGFVCHLCLGPTNPEAKYPEPDFPVIDHVAPLGTGGDHTPSNWAVAHNLCNSRRRDLDIDEFRSRYLARPTWADTLSRHGGHTMGGRGQVPKDQSLSRRTKGGTTLRVIEVEAMPQPELPTRYKTRDDEDGTFTDIIDWPTATIEWWDMWAVSPLSAEFTQSDWEELKMAALLHAQFVEGDYKLAAELRLRTAKFGTTPEDRARLKIQFALADEAEDRSERRKSSKQPKPGNDPRLKLA